MVQIAKKGRKYNLQREEEQEEEGERPGEDEIEKRWVSMLVER